jgi:hypothetical protein
MEMTISRCVNKSIEQNKEVIIPAATNQKRKIIHKCMLMIDRNLLHRSVWYGKFIQGRYHNAVEIVPSQVFINTIIKLTELIKPIVLLVIKYQSFSNLKRKKYY